MAEKADTLIIVSPFVADDISKLMEDMTSIKKITIYTTLQKFDDTAQKAIALYKFYEYCKGKSIDLLIKIDDNLHGKVYLFYDGEKPRGFVLTSGNFTENVLVNNHEYGLCIVDADKQKEMSDILMSVKTYDLSYMQLCEIYDYALKFIKKHPVVHHERFKVHKLINRKPSSTQNGSIKYYLKPIGTSHDPFIKSRVIKEVDMLGFVKNPKTIQKGDVLLLHGVGPSCIVGYYIVISDEAVYDKIDDSDRWPWKVKAECYSSKFSADWWNYELKTQELVDEFLETKQRKHITMKGGDTLGALKWGKDKVEITKDFAKFVIDKIPG
jgi:hypothetical protein